MTDEDKKEIKEMIERAITEFALKLPAVISNLVQESTAKVKMFQEFITSEDNAKAFQDKIGLVTKIIMEVDDANPGKPYQEILGLASPIIKERLNLMSGMDFSKPKKPTDLKYKGELGKL